MAQLLSGDYDAALAASDRARPLLWTVRCKSRIWTIITIPRWRWRPASTSVPEEQQDAWRTRLAAHTRSCEPGRQTRARRPSPTSNALVAAEIARLEDGELEAERLYEEAIRLSRENGFVQNEGIANELAARFYAARGLETIADAYLRNARSVLSALGRGRQGPPAGAGAPASAARSRHRVLIATIGDAGRATGPRDRRRGVAGGLRRDRSRRS